MKFSLPFSYCTTQTIVPNVVDVFEQEHGSDHSPEFSKRKVQFVFSLCAVFDKNRKIIRVQIVNTDPKRVE